MTESIVPTAVFESFDIPTDARVIFTGDGHMNQSWIISDEHVRRFVLKRYNSYRALDDIEREHRYLQELEGLLDCAVPLPVANVASFEERHYGLFRYIPGDHPNETPEAIEGAAGLLAHVHCRTYGHAELFIEAGEGDADDLTAPQNIAAALKAVGIGAGDEDFAERLEVFYNRVQETLQNLDDCLSQKHLIHGDFGFTNLIDTGTDGFALIDWDEMRIASPLMEVAGFCAFTETTSKDTSQIGFVSAYLKALKAGGYGNVKAIERGLADLPALIDVVRYRELSEMVSADLIEEEYIGMLLP